MLGSTTLHLVLRDLGQPVQARPLLERALTTTETVHGPDRPSIAFRLGNLATVMQDLGQPGQARPLLERAVAIAEIAWGPQHPSTRGL